MTDTYLLPEVHIVITQVPGVDGIASPARLTQIETDLATVLTRPDVATLGDIPDVNAPAPVNGDVIRWNATTETWDAVAPGSGIQIRDDGGSSTGFFEPNAVMIWARPGLAVSAGTPGAVFLAPVFGTAANTIAQGNHTHGLYPDTVLPFSASGTLSSGTRTLVSGTVSGLDPARQYRLRGWLMVHARGDGTGASFVMTRVTINGVNKSNFEESRLVAGVLVTEPTIYPTTGAAITGVTSVSVSAAAIYQSGDPAYIGGGVLVIEVASNR